jgi:virginiamycin A acetyltransferase
MIASLWHYFLTKVKRGLRASNIVQVKDKNRLHASVKLKDVSINGNIAIQEQSKLIDGVTIVADSEVTIGRYTTINGPGTDVYAQIHPVHIGSFCSIARQVSIQEYNHKLDRLTTYFIGKNLFKDKSIIDVYSKGTITIGNDVWIGAHCVILSGVTIGHGAVVAANTVVASDVPPYAIVSGSPAKVMRYRFPEPVIEVLLKLKWWDWSYEKIVSNKALFSETLTLESLNTIS